MVTKRQLQAEAAKQEAKAAEAKQKAEADRERWRIELDASNERRARTMLAGDLGAALLRWNAAGLRQIKLDASRVWRVPLHGCELYGDPFSLGFYVEPEYGPLKTLITVLERAGYKAYVVAEEHGNVNIKSGCDGMEIEDAPGTHTEYFLVIDWS